MEKEKKPFKMETHIMDNGRMIFMMEQELLHGKLEVNMGEWVDGKRNGKGKRLF